MARRMLRAFFIYVCIPYLSIIGIFTCFQRKLIYRATPADNLATRELGLSAESVQDIRIDTNDGDTLRGWHFRHRDSDDLVAPNPLVIYFAGNAGNRSHRIVDTREIASAGFDVLIFDYRGFGDSSGSPTEAKLEADAKRIWTYARDTLRYSEEHIVLFGESLGGAVALSLWSGDSTTHPRPAAVILNSTFASMPEVIKWHYPYSAFQYLVLDRWMSSDRIADVRSPLTLFHGTADEIVPIAQSQILAGKSTLARLIEIPHATHNNVPFTLLRAELESVHRSIVLKNQSLTAPASAPQ